MLEGRLVALEAAQADASTSLGQLSTAVAQVAGEFGATGASLSALQVSQLLPVSPDNTLT